MHPLEFDGTSYLSQGKRTFLISGEIHYFRVRPEAWRDRLEKWKAAGGNCVATYVPWLIHEPEEGRFVFDDPETDFEAFLKLCQELGLWAVVRPGPYQYSELAYDGLPGWLCEKYPQMLARDLAGKVIHGTSVSYMHPLFLQKARLWYAQVIPRLAKYQAHSGGAVALAQFDNEMMGIHRWHSGLDYHPESMGVGREEGPWTEFLKARHGSLEALGQAWALPLKSWAGALPLAPKADPGLVERRRLKDYQDYYFERIADYSETLAGWMRSEGMRVPLVHNSPNPGSNADFEAVVKRLGKNFLLGSDHYYNLDLDWEADNPTPKYAARALVSLRMLGHLGVPPTVLELPGGSPSDYPPITGHDAACSYLANLALGMKGFNYYIFAGGANRPGTGTTGEIYDFGAALSPSGEVRELYYAQMGLAEFLADHDWLAGASQVCDFRIGLAREYSRGASLGGPGEGLDFSMGEAWQFLHKGLILTAACAGLSPELIDLQAEEWADQVETPLAIACCRSLSRDIQERLARFVERGGKLLLAPVVPDLDEFFQPCAVLAEALGGVVKQRKVEAASPRLKAWGVENIYVNGPVFTISSRPATGEPKAREERSRREAGFLAKVGDRGGLFALLGLSWRQAKREHEQMLAAVLKDLGCQPRLRKDNPNLWAVLRGDGKKNLLFVLNLFSSPMSGKFEFRDPETDRWVDCGEQELPGVSGIVLKGKKIVYKTWGKP